MGGFSYHCFNCLFTTKWESGSYFSKNNVKLMEYLDVPQKLINKCRLATLGLSETESTTNDAEKRIYSLPSDARLITELLEEGYDKYWFIKCCDYIFQRNPDYIIWETLYWSRTNPKYFIIPVRIHDKIVGYNMRATVDGVPKYVAQVHKDFLYGANALYGDRKYCIITEGILDAMSISGTASMSNVLTDSQIQALNSAKQTKIILPDKDSSGKIMMDIALDNEWLVSFPEWNCKDADDAVRQYGQVSTLKHIFDCVQKTPFKIKMGAKNYFKEH